MMYDTTVTLMKRRMRYVIARSYQDGIDFYVHDKDMTISARMEGNGEISIQKIAGYSVREGSKYGGISLVRAIFFSVLFFLIISVYLNSHDIRINIMLFVLMCWAILFFDTLFSRRMEDKRLFQFHAAEHKVFNYEEKYNKVPTDVAEVMKMPSISSDCGYTAVVVIFTLVTFCVAGFLFLPNILLKILTIPVSISLTSFLYRMGFLNFLQYFVVIEPSKQILNLAMMGFQKYRKVQNDEDISSISKEKIL